MLIPKRIKRMPPLEIPGYWNGQGEYQLSFDQLKASAHPLLDAALVAYNAYRQGLPQGQELSEFGRIFQAHGGNALLGWELLLVVGQGVIEQNCCNHIKIEAVIDAVILNLSAAEVSQ